LNGDYVQNGKQKRPPSPPSPDISKKKKIEGPTITEITLDEEEMNLEELIKQKVIFININKIFYDYVPGLKQCLICNYFFYKILIYLNYKQLLKIK